MFTFLKKKMKFIFLLKTENNLTSKVDSSQISNPSCVDIAFKPTF